MDHWNAGAKQRLIDYYAAPAPQLVEWTINGQTVKAWAVSHEAAARDRAYHAATLRAAQNPNTPEHFFWLERFTEVMPSDTTD